MVCHHFFLNKGSRLISSSSLIGYKWHITTAPTVSVRFVSLNTSSLVNSRKYYVDVLGMALLHNDEDATGNKSERVGYVATQTQLEFYERKDKIGVPIQHEAAFGRVAIGTKSGPKHIFDKVTAANGIVQHGPVSLDTPGKATVEVVIVQDSDKYAWVGSKGGSCHCLILGVSCAAMRFALLDKKDLTS